MGRTRRTRILGYLVTRTSDDRPLEWCRFGEDSTTAILLREGVRATLFQTRAHAIAACRQTKDHVTRHAWEWPNDYELLPVVCQERES